MPQNFIAVDRDQVLLMPPSLQEWLPAEHYAWFVLASVEQMDLSTFLAGYRPDGHGRPAHDPALMVALLIYAYSRGVCSSRMIERACVEDVAFRVIAANQKPDHATIARFRRRHEAAVAGLFTEVLELCAEAGLAKVGMIAIDGSKLSANASQESTRGYEQIVRELLNRAEQTDEREDELYGDRRGDELPQELTTREGRKKVLADAKRKLIERRAGEQRPIPKGRTDRLKEAKRRLEEEHDVHCQANQAYEHWRATGRASDGRRFGKPANPYVPSELPDGRINVTDLDSGSMKTLRGHMQGYNVQAACNEQQIVIAAEVTVVAPDFGSLEPMVLATLRELDAAGIEERPGVVLADAGYWHTVQMENVINHGMQVLIPPDAAGRQGARPGWEGGYYDHMRRVLASDYGHGLYKRRQSMIEPVFAHTKFNRKLIRFMRRGRSAVRSEWRLMTATHNLLKLYSNQIAITGG
jgi:transposase